jgi:hypothetical protein
MSNDSPYDGFDSLDSTVIVIDEPGDRTVRPCRTHIRPILEAIKKKLEQYGKSDANGEGQSQNSES